MTAGLLPAVWMTDRTAMLYLNCYDTVIYVLPHFLFVEHIKLIVFQPPVVKIKDKDNKDINW